MGSSVELRCVFPERHTFDLDDLYVYWQISVVGQPKTVTYYLSGNSSTGQEDDRYRDRARLSPESMQRGDFSLHLYNITPYDEQKFNCLVFRKSLELKKILDVEVTLHVAGKSTAADGTLPTPTLQPRPRINKARFRTPSPVSSPKNLLISTGCEAQLARDSSNS